MPRQDDENELKPEAQMASWFRVHTRMQLAAGVEPAEWADLDESAQAAFGYAFNEARRMIGDAVEGTTWTSVAAELYDAWRRVAEEALGGLPLWEHAGDKTQLHWQCLVRHMVNLLSYDPEEHGSLDEHEERIAGFYDVKLKELGMTERQIEVAKDQRERDEETKR